MGEVRPVPVRASDDDRSSALEVLRLHCSAGTLTLDEFSDRCVQVLRAGTREALEELSADLPALRAAGHQDLGVKRVIALFGSNRRRAKWRVGRRATALAIAGTSWLDLRQAQVSAEELTIRGLALFGSVKVIVPPHVGVELTGMSLFGAKTDHSGTRDLLPAPVVRVRVLPVFGSVRVLTTEP